MQIFGIIFSTHFSQEIVQNQFHFMATISFSLKSSFFRISDSFKEIFTTASFSFKSKLKTILNKFPFAQTK